MFADHYDQIWVFGDVNPDSSTPHIYVETSPREAAYIRSVGQLSTLPITDGHGQREEVGGFFLVKEAFELADTTAEDAIRRFWGFNLPYYAVFIREDGERIAYLLTGDQERDSLLIESIEDKGELTHLYSTTNPEDAILADYGF